MKTIISFLRLLFFCLVLQTVCSIPIFAQRDTTKTDDYTYGIGGTKLVIINHDKSSWLVDTLTQIKDKQGHIKEEITIYTDSNHVTTKDHYYFEDHSIIRMTKIKHDLLGNEILNGEQRYGTIKGEWQQTSGFYKEIDENGKKRIMRYNTKSKDWEEVKDNVTNQLFGGFALIREDSKPTSFNTIGGALIFEHFYPNGLGYTALASVTSGTNSGISYVKETGLIGCVLGLKPHKEFMGDNHVNDQYMLDARFTTDVHILAGVSSIQSSIGSYKNTSHYFTGDLGINENYSFSKGFSVRIGGDIMPTFSKGSVQYNVMFTTGIVLKIWSLPEARQTIE